MATVSFVTDIVPLFDAKTDIPHMAKFQTMLADYDYMSNPNNAKEVLDHLTGAVPPIMPPSPAQPWPVEKINLFKAWMDGGYQR